MTTPDLPDLIDRLGAASLEARELLADVRSTTRELRTEIRNAAAERERITDLIKKAVAADIEAEVKTQLSALGELTRKAMDDAVAKVGREFDKLTNIMMTGDDYGRGTRLPDLVAEQARRKTLGGGL